VPQLPAVFVNRMLADPRSIPYLFVWRSPDDGTVQEAVRVSGKIDPAVIFPPEWTGLVELKRPNGVRGFIRTTLRNATRGAGRVRLLVCGSCQRPCRGLYGWEPGGPFTSSALPCSWRCRTCAGLRYASEGGVLVLRGRGGWCRQIQAGLGSSRSDRPTPWWPELFTSIEDAISDGLATSIHACPQSAAGIASQ
jgi:hypothetical protein